MVLVQEGHWREERGLFLMSSPPTALHVSALRVWELEKQAAVNWVLSGLAHERGAWPLAGFEGSHIDDPWKAGARIGPLLWALWRAAVSNTEYGSGTSPLNKAFDSILDAHVNCGGSSLVNVYNVLGRLGKIYGACNLFRPIWDGAGFKAFLFLGERLSSLRALGSRWDGAAIGGELSKHFLSSLTSDREI